MLNARNTSTPDLSTEYRSGGLQAHHHL